MTKPKFCNYEHLGPCATMLTHRAEYWLGEARTRFGRYAYWCERHAPSAQHLQLEQLPRPIPRTDRASVVRRGTNA